MPDLLTRKKHEDEAAFLILYYLQDAEATLRAGGIVNWLDWTGQLSRELTPILAATYLEAAEQLAGEYEGRLQDAEDRARQWASQQASWLAGSMATTTQQAIQAAQAASPDGYLDDLAHVFGDGRAEAAAITETTESISYGELFASQELNRIGIFLFPYWVTERDDKVCPVCRPLDGRPREEWWSQHGAGPPAHVRCRCFLEWREER